MYLIGGRVNGKLQNEILYLYVNTNKEQKQNRFIILYVVSLLFIGKRLGSGAFSVVFKADTIGIDIRTTSTISTVKTTTSDSVENLVKV